MRYAMIIDLTKCVGCNACTIACKTNNGTPAGIFWSRVLTEERGSYPNARMEFTPILCMHCKNAPCVRTCPTGASQKLEDGLVWIDEDKCIGCRSCILACPYEARSINEGKPKCYYPEKGYTDQEKAQFTTFISGVVTKCNFCMDRVREGKEPACVQTCVAKARHFGDLDDPESNLNRLICLRGGATLLSDFGTEPSVFYLPR